MSKRKGYFSLKSYTEEEANPKKVIAADLVRLQNAISSEVEQNDNMRRLSSQSSRTKSCGSFGPVRKLKI